ncbi:MAG: putative major facilitator superfamily transporter [Clostridia bacterium]|jgi:MFS family permease|nr:putative major facilitator superfamily transporter [Clostridia bacterium]
MKNHPLIATLINLRGNPRACLYPEPLWGIPYNLYMPYVSVYMITLGVTDTQIGMIVSISTLFQIIFSLLGGAVNDKLGRKATTFIFDILSWSVPCLIWAAAQNIYYFIVAAVINAMWRVTMISWGCLFVEDAEQKDIVNMWSLVYISGLLVAFIAPITGFLINKFSLVTTMRMLFVLSFVMMTIKFIIVYIFSEETKRGKIRMEETKNTSLCKILIDYRNVLAHISRSPKLYYTIVVLLIITICRTTTSTFWSIIVTEKIRIPVENIAFFPFIRSSIMLIFFFATAHRISAFNLKRPMITGFLCFIFSQLLLITLPERGYMLLVVSTFLEACAMALVDPLSESMLVLNASPEERSRMTSIIYAVILIFSLPFGYISGMLSDMNKAYPFILNISLFLAALCIILKSNVALKDGISESVGG